MKEQLIELWCKATKEKELEEYTEDTRNLYDYTMKMVECIKDTKESSDAIIIEQKEKIERLNNIINELEKWLKECKDMCVNYTFDETYECEYNYFQQIAIADFIKSFILNKLQELKDSDK